MSSPRTRTELPDDPVPFPGHLPRSSNAASYTITQAGHVRRSDGTLVVPSVRARSGACAGGSLFVRLSGGKASRSMAKAMWDAFGEKRRMPRRRKDAQVIWIPWHDPASPKDPVTGQPRCSVHDVYLVTRSDSQRYAQYGIEPAIKIPIC